MSKQILTLDNLYQFFVNKNESVRFSIRESGKPIVVKTNGFFEADNTDMPGMLKLKLKVCHTQVNRNGSNISKENMEKAMPTLKYRPILAYIHELEDGTKDFYAHNMQIVENEDGEADIVYIEKQVGCFTADAPWLEYDEEMDKTYVMAYAVIPEDYTEAADIIRRKNGTKVSCELVINELSYNAKEKYLDLTDFYFGGTTLLGCDEDGNEIGEGMLGARADISDFCYKEPVFTYQEKMIEVLDKLNTTLSNFNNTTIQEGGCEMNKFEELLAQYGIAAEDVTFDTDGLSDEELEAKFEEVFGEQSDDSNDGTSGDDGSVEGATDDGGEPENFTKTFSVQISHEETAYALYNLITKYEEEDNDYYFIKNVYDNYFYMQGWYNNKIYKVGYSIDGQNVSLEGERQEMFEIIVSESEKLSIEKMREEYDTLKAFKESYDVEKLNAEKKAILDADEYSAICDTEEFKTLYSQMDSYSIDELKVKADLIFADVAKKQFALDNKSKKASVSVRLDAAASENKKKPYGDLFED